MAATPSASVKSVIGWRDFPRLGGGGPPSFALGEEQQQARQRETERDVEHEKDGEGRAQRRRGGGGGGGAHDAVDDPGLPAELGDEPTRFHRHHAGRPGDDQRQQEDRKSTRLNSS